MVATTLLEPEISEADVEMGKAPLIAPLPKAAQPNTVVFGRVVDKAQPGGGTAGPSAEAPQTDAAEAMVKPALAERGFGPSGVQPRPKPLGQVGAGE